MATKRTESKPRKTGLAHHVSTVALTPARSLTSHVRHRYRQYRGRYRFAALVLGFDAFLVFVAAALIVFNFVLLFQSSYIRDAGLDLSFSAPELVGSDPVPVQARVRTTDGRIHEDVVLTWTVPEWVEIVRAEPVLRDRSVRFGRVVPGEEYVSTLVVRIRAERGTPVPFGFTVRQFDFIGLQRTKVGFETRIVGSSTFGTRIPVGTRTAVSGASIPLVLTYRGTASVSAATLRLTAADGAPDASIEGSGAVSFERMEPGEERTVFIDLATTTKDAVKLEWEVQDGAQVAVRDSATFRIVEEGARATGRIDATSPREPRFIYANPLPTADFLVAHPSISVEGRRASYIVMSAAKGEGNVEIGLGPWPAPTGTRWSVLPIAGRAEDGVLLGRASGPLSRELPFSSVARFYSVSGDHLGYGPLPPKVGEKTSYWIVWSVGPGNIHVRDLSFSADLPQGVAATGKYASPYGGAFRSDDAGVSWSVPSLDISGNDEATFAFEVVLTPTPEMENMTPVILTGQRVTARDAATGDAMSASAPSVDTQTPSDPFAKGKGTVTR